MNQKVEFNWKCFSWWDGGVYYFSPLDYESVDSLYFLLEWSGGIVIFISIFIDIIAEKPYSQSEVCGNGSFIMAVSSVLWVYMLRIL